MAAARLGRRRAGQMNGQGERGERVAGDRNEGQRERDRARERDPREGY